MIFNMIFNIGAKDFGGAGSGENDNNFSSFFDMSDDEQATMHLLCLMPAGSTLRFYNLETFDD